MENIILIDWLTFTAPVSYFDTDVYDFIGVPVDHFSMMDHGYWGYQSRMHFDGINVLSGGNNDTVCVNLSGTGCRSFESVSRYSLFELVSKLVADSDYIKITRIDLAFDDLTGVLDMQRLLDDTDEHNYTSRSQWWLVEYGSEGECIYFGSPKSNTRVRIYNKAAERGYKSEEKHWIRVELQLRDVNALGACRKLCENAYDIGYVFRGILRNYLVFRVPQLDTNSSRWPVSDYWQNLLDQVSSIRVFSEKGKEYNLFHLSNYVLNMSGSAIRTYADIVGLDQLIFELQHRSFRRSSRQRILLNSYDIEMRLEHEKIFNSYTDTFFCG